jgi:hypothetical protein
MNGCYYIPNPQYTKVSGDNKKYENIYSCLSADFRDHVSKLSGEGNDENLRSL